MKILLPHQLGGSVLVKICGVKDPEDAEYAVLYGTNYVGSVLARSPRRIGWRESCEIASVLPSHVKYFAVVDAREREWFEEVLKGCFDGVQLHWGDEAIHWVPLLRSHGLLVSVHTSRPLRGPFEYLLVDVKKGDKVYEYWKVKSSGLVTAIAGGLNEENVCEIVRSVKPDMVDVSSGIEREPGKKDKEKMRMFIERARKCLVPDGGSPL